MRQIRQKPAFSEMLVHRWYTADADWTQTASHFHFGRGLCGSVSVSGRYVVWFPAISYLGTALLVGDQVQRVNSRQKKIQDSWPLQLEGFAKREWFSLFLSSSLGIVVAELLHLIWQDHAFQNSITTHYKPWVSSDDTRYYLPYLATFLFVLLLAFGPPLCMNVWRGLKSWGAGVTSGLVLLPFASAFCISILPAPSAPQRLLLAFCLAITLFMASFRL